MKKRLIGSLLILAVGLSTVLIAQPSYAAVGSDFNAGRIIDDVVFYNENALDANTIQTFLNNQVPTCDTNGTRPASEFGRPDITRAQYAALKGWQSPPYTCLRNYVQNTPQMEAASGYCNALPALSSQSAAQIINSISKACHINPQVLLVLLQKEQSLVLDTWPLDKQYRNATGFACPDTAPCDPAYGGFFYQVYYAARQFQVYKARPNSYNYVAGRTNNIYYSPNLSGCGSSPVYIQNQATAALYIYTPYQPNAAALNNLYGTGDSCSAYGNRNFWRLFTDWFGSTLTPSFSASYRAQSTNVTIEAGSSQTVYMQFTNEGTAFWKDDASTFPGYNPIRLAATNPINRASQFSSSDWLTPSRPNGTFTKVLKSDGWNLATDQHTVNQGEIAEYQFKLSIPSDQKSGTYREYFQPILEGAPNYSLGVWIYIDITVVEKSHTAEYVGQSSYPELTVGGQSNVFFKVRNSGTATWRDSQSTSERQLPVRLATTGPINKSSQFRANNWFSSSRPTDTFTKVYLADGVTLAPDQHQVQPGQIAEYQFTLSAPSNISPGTYREYFQPILEGSNSYDMGLVMHLDVTVKPQVFAASYVGQSAYPTITRGGTQSAYFKVRNTGTMFWKDDTSTFPGYSPVRLATTGPINRASVFSSNSWLSPSRPNGTFSKVYLADGVTLASDQHTVLPGQIAEYQFTLTAPANTTPGTYKEYFQPILEGARSYDMGSVMYLNVTVN